jgi:hypothetical protein
LFIKDSNKSKNDEDEVIKLRKRIEELQLNHTKRLEEEICHLKNMIKEQKPINEKEKTQVAQSTRAEYLHLYNYTPAFVNESVQYRPSFTCEAVSTPNCSASGYLKNTQRSYSPLSSISSLSSNNSYSSSNSTSSSKCSSGVATGERYVSNGSANGREIYEGPRGGRYYLTASGNKRYL